MDLENFRNALLGVNSNDPEIQKQCNEIIMSFQQENFLQYIQNLILITSDIHDCISASVAILLLYREIKTGTLFGEIKASEHFWNQIVQIIPNVFLSDTIPSNIKMLISNIIALFAIEIFKTTGNNSIQQYVLSLYQQHPEFEMYILECIMEIIIGSDDMGGFSFEIVLALLTSQIRYEESFIPHCKLFFTAAMKFPDNQLLSHMFEEKYRNIPIQYLNDFLSVIDNFAEKSAIFFEAHLSSFIPFLCSIALNKECNSRNMALFCLGSIAKGSPLMCSTRQEYYENVISCLFSVVSEINDDSPLDFDSLDLNDNESYNIARDVIKTIAESNESSITYLECAEKIFQETSKQVPFSWQNVYAIAIIYTDFGKNTINLILENSESKDFSGRNDYTFLIQFVKRFLPFLQDPNTNPRLKISIYNLFQSISSNLINFFQDGTADILLPIIKTMVLAENIKEVKIAAANALVSYFEGISDKILIKFYPQSFNELLIILQNSPEYLYSSLIKGIGSFAALGELFLPNLFKYISELCNYYFQTQDRHLKLQIIFSITKICYRFISDLSQYTQDLIKMFLHFLNDLIQMIQIIDENSDPECTNCLLNILNFLKNRAIQFVPILLPYAIGKASEEIEIIQYQQFDSIQQSLHLLQIPSDQAGIKLYALHSDVNTVSFGLKLMNCLSFCMEKNITNFLEKYISIIQKWITNSYFIQEIKLNTWNLLYQISNNFINQYNKLKRQIYDENYITQNQITPEINENTLMEQLLIIKQLLHLFFTDFNLLIGKGDLSFNSQILFSLMHILEDVTMNEWYDQDLIIESLNKLVLFSDCLIEGKMKSIADSQHFSDPTNSKKIDEYNTILDYMSSLFQQFLNQYTELTIAFYRHSFLLRINQYLNEDISLDYGIQLMTDYINKIQSIDDATNWILYLFNIGIQRNDHSPKAFLLLTNILKEYELPGQFAEELRIMFEGFLEKPDNGDNPEEDCFYDYCLAAFSVFIQKNENVINYESALNTWVYAFPVWNEFETSDYVYKFLATLFEERNTKIFEDLDRFLSNVLNNINCSMMSQETNDKFVVILNDIVHDPIYGKRIIDYVNSENNSKTKILLENILNSQSQQ